MDVGDCGIGACNQKPKGGRHLSHDTVHINSSIVTSSTCLERYLYRRNDAKHSWHLTRMAFVLGEYANASIDVLKTMKMVMLHDVIENDAGDTYAYDTAGNATKRIREVLNG